MDKLEERILFFFKKISLVKEALPSNFFQQKEDK